MSGQYVILIDTREQKPYKFPGQKTRPATLDVGDYTIEGLEKDFAVERKTLDDFARSVGADRERFEDEIQRGEQSMMRLEVVIEAPPDHVYDYADTKHSPKYYSDIYPNSIIGTIESWEEKYDSLGFTWAENRRGGRNETLRLLDKWYIKYQM